MELMKLTLRLAALILLAAYFSACAPAGSPAVSSTGISNDADKGTEGDPVATPESVVVKSGRDFSCFLRSGVLRCRSSNAVLEFTHASYTSAAVGSVVLFEVWDDTVCYEATVSKRPYSGTPGVATYCFGEASLQNTWGAVVFGGPQFGVSHQSPDLAQAAFPFVGADSTLSFAIHTPAHIWMQDSRAVTTEQTLSCSSVSGVLTCPGFSVAL